MSNDGESGWVVIHPQYGKFERPDMSTFEAAWLLNMKRNPNYDEIFERNEL